MQFSLHQREGSPYWYAFFRTPDPKNPGKLKQHFKSTKATSKKEAATKAPQIIEAALKEAGAGDEKSREIYGLLRDAADLAAKGHLNEAQGRVFLSKMLEVSTGKGVKSYSVRGWFEGWLDDKRKANSQGTYIRYKGVVNQFLDFLGDDRANGNLMSLTADEIREFRDAEHASGKSPNTVNDSLKTIRTALNKARRSQVLLANPAENVDKLVEDEIEKAVFTPSDLAKLLSVAGESWKGVILSGYYLGANLRDITNMRWSQIDLAAGLITYRRQKTRLKTKKEITIPIHSDLSDWLIEQPTPDDPRDFVFPDLAGKSTAGKSGLSMKFGRLLKKAKLSGEEIAPAEVEGEKKTKGRTRNTLTFHSLRHSFNSAMANAGVLQEVRQKLTGHSSATTNDGYTHHQLEVLKAAVNSVPTIEKGKK